MYRLLIADDEMIERDAVKYILGRNFIDMFEISEACNGKEAIEKAASFKPDIIFLDIKMPGTNGLEAAARIRDILPECRIILISAYHYFNYAKDALSIGADDYITKPAPPEKIISTLEKVICLIEESRAKKKKEEETDSKLKQITQYLESELLALMASGETEERVIKNYFDILNINCESYICCVLSIFNDGYRFEITGEVQKAVIKRRVIEKLKSKLRLKGFDCFTGSIGQEIYLLLFLEQHMDEYESRLLGIRLLSEIRKEVREEIQVNLNAGIGNVCHLILDIYNSFLQAKLALKYDITPGTITSYGDISKGSSKTEYPINKEKQLCESMMQLDEKNSSLLLDELIDWIAVNTGTIEELKQKIYELLLVLVRQLAISVNPSEFNADTESLRKTMLVLDSVREARAYAKKYLIETLQEISTVKTSRINSLLSIVMNYIEKNYSNEISLEEVAEVVKISPFYLSKLFKQETGENFIDYLTTIRIRKAKELLFNPMNSVKDVCYMVGYKDPNYFTRVFKKVCGQTPTEFKNVL